MDYIVNLLLNGTTPRPSASSDLYCNPVGGCLTSTVLRAERVLERQNLSAMPSCRATTPRPRSDRESKRDLPEAARRALAVVVFASCAGLGGAVGPVSLGHGMPIDIRILGFQPPVRPPSGLQRERSRTRSPRRALSTHACRGPEDPDPVHPDLQSNDMTTHMDRVCAAQVDGATIQRVVQEPDEKLRALQR